MIFGFLEKPQQGTFIQGARKLKASRDRPPTPPKHPAGGQGGRVGKTNVWKVPLQGASGIIAKNIMFPKAAQSYVQDQLCVLGIPSGQLQMNVKIPVTKSFWEQLIIA